MKESNKNFCLGILYDAERLYLFKKHNGKFLRFSDEYNTKGDESKTKELSLNLPDPYLNIPNFDVILDIENEKEKG